MNGFIQEVQNCYKTTDQHHPDIKICVAGDLILYMATIDRQLPPNIHTNFINNQLFNDRMNKIANSPYFFGSQHTQYASDKNVALLYCIGDGLAPYVDDINPLHSLIQHCRK